MNIFDFDGTLVDSNGVWEAVDLAFLGRHGLEPTREYGETVGQSIFPLAAQYTKDYYRLELTAQEIMDEWMALAWEAYAHQVPLKPGAREFLAQCRDRGEGMALLTACVPELCRAALARHDLTQYFSDLIFVQEMGLTKGTPEVFLQAARRLGVAPGACTMYEDSPAACAAAKAAGMDVVGVYDPFYAHRAQELRRICRRYITGFPELLAR